MMETAFSFPLPPVPPFKAAAAVLTSFDLAALQPAGSVEDRDAALVELMLECQPAEQVGESQRWQLEEVPRREALFRLAQEAGGLRRALDANPNRPDTPVQRGIDELISGNRLSQPFEQRSLEDLLGLARAVDWLSGAIDELPPRESLIRQIEVKRLLKPFQRLLSRGFVGRATELSELHEYVRSRGGSRILSLHGPGGVGKSTLLARFLMEVVAPEMIELRPTKQFFPFVYLDVDRTVVDPKDPASFAKEAARQLGVQIGGDSKLVESVQRSLVGISTRTENLQLESVSDAPAVAPLLLMVTEQLYERTKRPTLFIIDTWEELQAAGIASEFGIIQFLSELTKSPSVRVICAGRAALRLSPGSGEPADSRIEFSDFKRIDLQSFDRETARAYLEGIAKLPAQAVDPIIKAVGTTPLSLALAARLVEREGVQATADLVALVAKVKAEQVQGQLFARLLGHIHDGDLQKLAQPGLVVRRITPAIIRHVLAGPCEVSIVNDLEADILFLKLVDETALVEPDEDDEQIEVAGEPSWPLRYRADLRQLALPDLRRMMPEQVATIHALAIAWYTNQSGMRARAEEIYHRLANGDLPQESLWNAEMARWLRPGGMPELPARGRAWLLQRLGHALDENTRASADFEMWERDTADQVRVLLSRRDWRGALDLIRQRSGKGPASPLVLLEAQALVQGKAFAEAEALLSNAATMSVEQGEPARSFGLMLLLADVQERHGRFETAADTLRRAEPLRASADETEQLRSLLADLRIGRKLQSAHASRAGEARAALEDLIRHGVQRQLQRRPALLRETVAEIGEDHQDLVIDAVRILGVGQVRLPSSSAPLHLPAWLARLLGKTLLWFRFERLSSRFLRLTVDLFRTAIADGMPLGSLTLDLTEIATRLEENLRRDPTPATIRWCVQHYRMEVDAIKLGSEDASLQIYRSL